MEQKGVPHVLLFPFTGQGFMNPMLNFAELLGIEGLTVTFLNTEYNLKRLLRCTDIESRFAKFPSFRFRTIPDGLPLDHHRTLRHDSDLLELIVAIRPAYEEFLLSGDLVCGGRPPLTCIIADAFLTFDIAKNLGIPSIAFQTAGPSYCWTNFCLPKLIQTGQIPLGVDVDMEEIFTSVPGMQGFLRNRDLANFCRANEYSDLDIQLNLTETKNTLQASAQILNTFEDLDGSILSHIHSNFPKTYTIGPLHSLLDSRRKESPPSSSLNSFLEVDKTCMTWLDSQATDSVIYVSFGSAVSMTQNQMLEFWHGLVNSEKKFLWVIRSDSVTDKDESFDIPKELQEGLEKRGYIVGWAPQKEVLTHPAVGGFFTHSGWNSTLESIVAGVPMICWPCFADQQSNSRFVSEVWKIGLDMKDTCDRTTIERMIRDLMEDKREDLMKQVEKMAKMAKMSVSEGGSSYNNLDALIQDIKLMNLGAFDSKS